MSGLSRLSILGMVLLVASLAQPAHADIGPGAGLGAIGSDATTAEQAPIFITSLARWGHDCPSQRAPRRARSCDAHLAVAAVLRCEGSQALAHRRVVAVDRTVLLDRSREADDPAASPLAQSHLRL